jgi:hypothetical protein
MRLIFSSGKQFGKRPQKMTDLPPPPLASPPKSPKSTAPPPPPPPLPLFETHSTVKQRTNDGCSFFGGLKKN